MPRVPSLKAADSEIRDICIRIIDEYEARGAQMICVSEFLPKYYNLAAEAQRAGQLGPHWEFDVRRCLGEIFDDNGWKTCWKYQLADWRSKRGKYALYSPIKGLTSLPLDPGSPSKKNRGSPVKKQGSPSKKRTVIAKDPNAWLDRYVRQERLHAFSSGPEAAEASQAKCDEGMREVVAPPRTPNAQYAQCAYPSPAPSPTKSGVQVKVEEEDAFWSDSQPALGEAERQSRLATQAGESSFPTGSGHGPKYEAAFERVLREAEQEKQAHTDTYKRYIEASASVKEWKAKTVQLAAHIEQLRATQAQQLAALQNMSKQAVQQLHGMSQCLDNLSGRAGELQRVVEADLGVRAFLSAEHAQKIGTYLGTATKICSLAEASKGVMSTLISNSAPLLSAPERPGEAYGPARRVVVQPHCGPAPVQHQPGLMQVGPALESFVQAHPQCLPMPARVAHPPALQIISQRPVSQSLPPHVAPPQALQWSVETPASWNNRAARPQARPRNPRFVY